MKGSDVIVIGGGAIGLSIAWRMQQQGASVTVIERGSIFGWPNLIAPEGQATWASAGLLAPAAESGRQSSLGELGIASLKLYPGFVDELSSESRSPISIQGPGLIRLARGREEAEELRQAYEESRGGDLVLEWIDTGGLARAEPALDHEPGPAIRCQAERHIAPRELLLALVKACVTRGVTFLDHEPVTAFTMGGGRVTTVETVSKSVTADQVVIAAGCWTGALTRLLGHALPVSPIRGQILALRCALLLNHAIYTHEGYLVPRADGQLIVGATEETAGYSSAVTAEGIRDLLHFATDLIPALAHAQFDSAWSGLRPATPDGMPFIGSMPGLENVHVAAGHFRNGILLTPITAALMARWVLEREEDPLLSWTRLDRDV